MSYLHKTPSLLKWYYPNLIWDFTTTDKIIYLTFDDGPTKDHTNWILKELEVYKAKATFCVENNIKNALMNLMQSSMEGILSWEPHIQSPKWK